MRSVSVKIIINKKNLLKIVTGSFVNPRVIECKNALHIRLKGYIRVGTHQNKVDELMCT